MIERIRNIYLHSSELGQFLLAEESEPGARCNQPPVTVYKKPLMASQACFTSCGLKILST
jgi:hypothetical protein